MTTIALNRNYESGFDEISSLFSNVKAYFSKEQYAERRNFRFVKLTEKLISELQYIELDTYNLDKDEIEFHYSFLSMLNSPLSDLEGLSDIDEKDKILYDSLYDLTQYITKLSDSLGHVIEAKYSVSIQNSFRLIDELESVQEEYIETEKDWEYINLENA